jgi:putative endopeptidase
MCSEAAGTCALAARNFAVRLPGMICRYVGGRAALLFSLAAGSVFRPAVFGQANPPLEKEPAAPRFSVGYMDLTVDPRSDFARFAAGRWYATTEIPADKSSWGGMSELGERNRWLTRAVLEDAARSPGAPGSVTQKVGDFYTSALDEAAIESAGLKPIEADLARIDAIASADDVVRVVAKAHAGFGSPLFNWYVYADQKQSDTEALYFAQGGLSLPSKDYYTEERFEKERTAFLEHVANMLVLAGAAPEAARQHAQTVFELEKALADASKRPVELRDVLANYHKMSRSEFAAAAPGFPVTTYFAEVGIPDTINGVVVRQPKFFAAVGELLQRRPLEDWKIYLRWRAISEAAPHLSSVFEKESFRFNSTVLNGVPSMEPRWQRASRVLDGQIGFAVGQLYVERYFPPAVKARLAEMIANLQATMRDRLENLEWMTPPTRAKAQEKFARFRAMIGFPPKWRDYSALTISRDNYFGNVRAASAFEAQRLLKKAGQKVDRDEWGRVPQQVNAYFQPTANQIVFLAGILQPPFFDPEMDDAVNYGAIGAVIGHEISHGFDDQGRRYDADGNLADWWTPQDAEQFRARAQKLVDQFNGYHALPQLAVNGQLTLGENIGDLGGVAIAFDALKRSLAGKPTPPKIDGFTAEQRFFLSWAQSWRTKFRDDALKRHVTSAVHSPGQFRAIGPLVNMAEFFEAFGIKEGDPMWRAPELRAKIW